jgi:SAM-dependent MidA family methyltransferase
MTKDRSITLEPIQSNGFEVLRKTGIAADTNKPEVQEIMALLKRSDTGKIPFSKFMEKSLYGQFGYYSSGKVEISLDKTTDFITASERSFFFGATIGDEVVRVWEALGSPDDFSVVEMGAGEGGMSESLLEYIKIKSPELFEKIRYNIVDLGKELIPRQRERLSKTGKQIQWVYGSATELPIANVNGVFISNELPDAFPVEQVVRNDKGELGQMFVGIDESGEWTEYWGEMTSEVSEYVNKYEIKVGHNDYVAINLLAAKFQENISKALNQGAVITFDYGALGQPEKESDVRSYAKAHIKKGDSGRNIDWKYKFVGDVDITADVNFKVLEDVAMDNGLSIAFTGQQGDLLQMMGMDEVMRLIVSNYKELSWKNILKVSKSMETFGMFHLGFYDFYGHILTKGVSSESVLSSRSRDERLLKFKIKFPIPGGKAGDTVIIDYKRGERDEVEIEEIDENGMIEVKPHALVDSKFSRDKRSIDEPDQVYYDFKGKDDLMKVLQEIGIKAD